MASKIKVKSKPVSTKSSDKKVQPETRVTAITQSSNLLLQDGKPRPVTQEMIDRGRDFGLSADKVTALLRAGTDYKYTPEGLRIEPKPYTNPMETILERENHHMIKPDPDGVYYLKVGIDGKQIIKPLAKDVVKARKMRDKYLKEFGYFKGRQ